MSNDKGCCLRLTDTMKGHLSDHLVYNKVEQYRTDNGLSTQQKTAIPQWVDGVQCTQ